MLCGCKARQEQNVLLSPLMADSSSGMCANCMRQKGKCMGLENHVSRENQVFWNYIKRPKKTPNDRHTMTQVYTGAIAQPTWIKADSKIDAWYDILGIKESSWKLMKAVWKLYEMYTSAPNKKARITGGTYFWHASLMHGILGYRAGGRWVCPDRWQQREPQDIGFLGAAK